MKRLSIESLDDSLSAGDAAMAFGQKKIIFEWAGLWFYHFTGLMQIPGSRVIYGSMLGDEWFVSRDVRKLIEHMRGLNEAAQTNSQAQG